MTDRRPEAPVIIAAHFQPFNYRPSRQEVTTSRWVRKKPGMLNVPTTEAGSRCGERYRFAVDEKQAGQNPGHGQQAEVDALDDLDILAFSGAIHNP